MNQEHYTIDDYSELFTETVEQEKEEKMLEHLEDCALCKEKMRAATLLMLLEDDEVLEMTMQLLLNANKNKDEDENVNADEDENEDLD